MINTSLFIYFYWQCDITNVLKAEEIAKNNYFFNICMSEEYRNVIKTFSKLFIIFTYKQ